MFIWTFLLRITHTIISQSSADSSWITLYDYITEQFCVEIQFCCLEYSVFKSAVFVKWCDNLLQNPHLLWSLGGIHLTFTKCCYVLMVMELGVELVFVWIKWFQDRMEDTANVQGTTIRQRKDLNVTELASYNHYIIHWMAEVWLDTLWNWFWQQIWVWKLIQIVLKNFSTVLWELNPSEEVLMRLKPTSVT